jgi:hypothetical protein
MMTKWVEWCEPLWDGAEPVYQYAKAEDIVAVRRRQEPRYIADGKTDQEVLDDFMVVHWAQFVEPLAYTNEPSLALMNKHHVGNMYKVPEEGEIPVYRRGSGNDV